MQPRDAFIFFYIYRPNICLIMHDARDKTLSILLSFSVFGYLSLLHVLVILVGVCVASSRVLPNIDSL